MAVYFSGRKRVGGFSQLLDSGSAKLDVEIFERWEDIDVSSIARCGESGFCEIEKSQGLSEKSSYNLKGVIESSLGIDGIVSLKAQVEEVLGHEVDWNRGIKITKKFEHSSPKCGRYVLTIYELRREYELTYSRRGWFSYFSNAWDQKWTRILREETSKHDGLPDVVEYDELCKCPKTEQQGYDGRVCFDLGDLSFRVPYRLNSNGFEVQIFERLVSFTFTDSTEVIRALEVGVNISLPTKVIPEALRFLGDVEGDVVEARVFKYLDPSALTEAMFPITNLEGITPIQAKSQVLN